MQQPSKKAKSRNLRNVLQNHFAINWSEKTLDEVRPVLNLLKEVLPTAKLEETKQRFKFNKRKEVSRKDVPQKKSPNINRSFLAIGFNHVIRSLERDELCCILLADDIQPPLLIKTLLAHVLGKGQWVGGASSAAVPVLVLPGFRDITCATLGYVAMTIGLKNAARDQENIFNPVYKWVCLNPTVLQTESLPTMEEVVQPEVNNDKTKATKHSDFEPKNVYLYRKNESERVFIPEARGKMETSTKERKQDDFLSLENPSSNKSSDFLAFKENTVVKVEKSNSDDQMEQDYDDSSDEEPDEDMFFVDNERDNSLITSFEKELKTNVVDKAEKNIVRKKSSKLPQGISKMFQRDKVKSRGTEEGRKKKKLKKCRVNFLPLKLKTVTGNVKRAHRKSKL